MDTETIETPGTTVALAATATTEKKAPAKAKAEKKAPAKAKAEKKAPKKTAKAKKPAKKTAKAKATPKAKKARAQSQVSVIGDFLISLNKAMSAVDVARKLKVNTVEVHRAVSRLEGQGYKVSATRAEATGKVGRRPFMYEVVSKPSKRGA